MKRVPVTSSTVAEVGYDPTSKTLELAFLKGGVYQYFEVPAAVYSGLLAAPSVGSFVHTNVKKAGYRYRRVSS